jgi:hypothetical protein
MHIWKPENGESYARKREKLKASEAKNRKIVK